MTTMMTGQDDSVPTVTKAAQALGEAVVKAAESLAVGGAPQGDTAAAAPLWSAEDAEGMKKRLQGTLLELKDGTFAGIPIARSVVGGEGRPPRCVVNQLDKGTEREEAWFIDNVVRAWPGVLTFGDKANKNTGHDHASRSVQGLPASLALDPGDANKLKLKVGTSP